MKLSLLAACLLLVVQSQADSASRPSHVVKVGRNGRQLVHRDGEVGLGARLGRKVRRKGRNTLPNAAPQVHHHAPALVRAVPQVFSAGHAGHQHLIHDAVPQTFHAVPEQFSHHHVPHAPANLFHFSHHSPAISPALSHHTVHAAPLIAAPVQQAAPVQHFVQHAQFLQPAPVQHFVQHAPLQQFVQHAPLQQFVQPAPLQQFVQPAPIQQFVQPAPIQQFVQPAPLPLAPVQPVAAPFNPPVGEVIAARDVFPVAAPLPVPAPLPVATPLSLEYSSPEPLYGAPAPLPAVPAPLPVPAPAQEVVEVEVVGREAANSYLGPAAVEVVELKAAPNSYLGPAAVEVVEAPAVQVVERIAESYLAVPVGAPAPAPVPAVISVPRAQPVLAVAPRDSYLASAPEPAVLAVDRSAVKSDILAATRAEPIAIIRSVLNAPDTLLAAQNGWDYSYESANGIKQEASGSLRLVDGSEATVMRGSYEFIGADGIVYAVEWFADETGFHATAPHLPRNVEPNHPEVAAAVRAQIAFAEAEDRTAAASGVVDTRARGHEGHGY